MFLTMDKSEENLINRIIYLMQKDDSTDAPADSVRWVKNLFRSYPATSQKSLVQKILAVLQVDFEPHRTIPGERSATASPERQMLFTAGNYQVDLRITKTKKVFSLKGQILGEGFAEVTVQLQGAGKKFTTETNKICEFAFENIEKGVYDLKVLGNNQEIIVEKIEIG